MQSRHNVNHNFPQGEEYQQQVTDLVNRYRPVIRKFLYRKLIRNQKSVELAEDLTQITLIKAAMRLPSFRHQAKVSSWLHAIALNCLRSHFRKSAHRQKFVLISEVENHLDKNNRSDKEVDPFLRASLIREIIKLHEPYRTTILLWSKGYSYDKIAEAMRCSLGTAKSRLHRAKAMLSANLPKA